MEGVVEIRENCWKSVLLFPRPRFSPRLSKKVKIFVIGKVKDWKKKLTNFTMKVPLVKLPPSRCFCKNFTRNLCECNQMLFLQGISLLLPFSALRDLFFRFREICRAEYSRSCAKQIQMALTGSSTIYRAVSSRCPKMLVILEFVIVEAIVACFDFLRCLSHLTYYLI